MATLPHDKHASTNAPGGLVVTLPVQCCDCRLWRVDTVWTPTPPPNVSRVSHTYCPPCAAKRMEEIKKLAA